MARFILIELALFLLPFAVFYVLAVRARRGEEVSWPWLWLSLAGLVVTTAAFIWFASVDGEDPGLHYQPEAEQVPYELSPDKPAYRQ
ncbi:MAG: hypothetical protein H6883_09605 [Rhodobiaceae bacterium]|nr:hypothetical protein [Rhodobiaceae bacterium]MCC0056382.1 hypothetical protein [Rhodobiaceae bacterium]